MCGCSLRGNQSDDDTESVSSGANELEPNQECLLLFCPWGTLNLRGPRPVFRLGWVHEGIYVTVHVGGEQPSEKEEVRSSAIHRAIHDTHTPYGLT